MNNKTDQINVILVDDNDKPIGKSEKLEVHRKGDLHRAFSVFIYDPKNDKFLIQKRAEEKYHSGGKWSNTACSHPYEGESPKEMIDRALKDELIFKRDFSVEDISKIVENDLKSLKDEVFYIDKFKYFSDYGEMKEHEIDSVYLYLLSDGVLESFGHNPEEVEELRWISRKDLEREYAKDPKRFSTWFGPAYKIINEFLEK